MDVKRILIGYDIIAEALAGRPTVIAMVLLGQKDEEIALAFAHTVSKKVGQPITVDHPDVISAVTRLKDQLEIVFSPTFRDRYRHRSGVDVIEKNNKELLQELKQSNKPSPLGTVSDIAEKFNVSKSEVRRRKADGTLHELLIKSQESQKDVNN